METLYRLLSAYGVEANDGILVEGDRSHYAIYPYVLLPDLNSDEITDSLIEENYFAIMPVSLGLTVAEDSSNGTVTQLMTTSESSFSKLAGYDLTTYEKEEGDIDGPFSLAAIATDTLEDGSESHVIWVGSTSLLDDQYNQQVSGANQDFFLNCVGWTCEGEEGVSIHAKQITTEYLTMSASTASMLTLLLVAVLPAGYLLFGLRIWIRRKHQ